MVHPRTIGGRPIRLPASLPPVLLVVVDTEEEFDWSAAFDSSASGVGHLSEVWRFQSVCEEFGVRPMYVVDYPIASQDESETTLKPLVLEGRAAVGAHLQPWVNPPFEEEINPRNSYPGNLPPELERAKLDVLVAAIEKRFGIRPRAYKAGRYGVGPSTPETLATRGFDIDLSVCPGFDFRADGGPDFSNWAAEPYWFGASGRMLELPVTGGFAGWLRFAGPTLHRFATGHGMRKARAEAILGRMGALARIRLSAEGFSFAETRALTEALLADGLKVFSFTLHSPSLKPGYTPYVRNETDLATFLNHIRQYFHYFLRERGGVPMTPEEVRQIALGQEREPGSLSDPAPAEAAVVDRRPGLPPAKTGAAVTATISVVIPARNTAETIERALRSVERQTLAPVEIVVVDDASTDDTRARVEARRDLPIRLISLPTRGGAANARNVGIQAATGEYIALLDADDEWLDTKLEKQIQLIQASPSMSFVSCRSVLLSLKGDLVGPIHGGVPVVTGSEAWRALLVANFVSTPCVLARRETILSVGGFDPSLPIAEDQDLWIRLALAGEVGFVDEVLVRVYERPGSLSSEYRAREADITLPMILRHLDLQRARMTQGQISQVLGTRFAQNGRRLYASGSRLRGLRYFWMSTINGYSMAENLWYIMTAAPGATWLKRHILGRGR